MSELPTRLRRHLHELGPEDAATRRARAAVIAQGATPARSRRGAAPRQRVWATAIGLAVSVLAVGIVTSIVRRDTTDRTPPAVSPLPVLERAQTPAEAQAAAARWLITTHLQRDSLRRLAGGATGAWFVGQTDDQRVCVVHVAPVAGDPGTLAVDGSACATPDEVRANHGIGLIAQSTLAAAVTGEVRAVRRRGGVQVRPAGGAVVLRDMNVGVDAAEVLVAGRWRTLPLRPGTSALRFSSLERPPAASDRLPESARSAAASSGVNLATVRRMPSDVDGRPYWLAWGEPRGLTLCLIGAPATVACAGTGLIEIAGAAPFPPGAEGGAPDRTRLTTAIIPDGYSAASAAGIEGVMIGNIVVFVEELPADADLLLTGAAGTRRVPIAAAP